MINEWLKLSKIFSLPPLLILTELQKHFDYSVHWAHRQVTGILLFAHKYLNFLLYFLLKISDVAKNIGCILIGGVLIVTGTEHTASTPAYRPLPDLPILI